MSYLVTKSGDFEVLRKELFPLYVTHSKTGLTTLYGRQEAPVSYMRDKFVGFRIPDFHRRVRSGELMPHTPWEKYSAYFSTEADTRVVTYTPSKPSETATWFDHVPKDTRSWYATFEDLRALVPTGLDSLVQEAAARIYENAHDTLTFVAELNQTRNMFLKAGRNLLKMRKPKSWRYLLKSLKNPTWVPKEVSSDWLEFRYGWRTFLYDCEDIHKFVFSDFKRNSRLRKKREFKQNYTTTNVFSQTLGSYTFECSSEDIITIESRGTVNADIPVHPRFQANPVQTAWELLPYSFVIDWFLGVGTSISAVSLLNLSVATAASFGCKITVNRTYSAHCVSTTVPYCSSFKLTQSGSGSASLEIRTPCLVPTLPRWTNELDAPKIVDLLSMIAQRVKGD